MPLNPLEIQKSLIFENGFSQGSIREDIRPILFLRDIGYRFFMAGIAAHQDRIAITELRGTEAEPFGLQLVEFNPEQRMLFRGGNILAIHESRVPSDRLIDKVEIVDGGVLHIARGANQ